MSDHITEFFKIYVEHAYEESTMFKHRIQIRGNQHLNKLLYDNTNGLRHIFERYKTNDHDSNQLQFTVYSARTIFEGLKHSNY